MRLSQFTILLAAAVLAVFVITKVFAGYGEGHTSVTLCHWVPAHNGSYITIKVDDDGSTGNGPLQAHLGHKNDIIPAPENGCPTGSSTETETPVSTDTSTPEATETEIQTPDETPVKATETAGQPSSTPTSTLTVVSTENVATPTQQPAIVPVLALPHAGQGDSGDLWDNEFVQYILWGTVIALVVCALSALWWLYDRMLSK